MKITGHLYLMVSSSFPPTWAEVVAGVFVVVTLSLSVFLIFEHLSAYKNPEEQKFLIGCIMMVPCYAIESPVISDGFAQVSNKGGITVICSKRGGDASTNNHNEWLLTVPLVPDVINFTFIPIISLLKDVLSKGFLAHAINLYLRYKPPISELEYFLDFQYHKIWAPTLNEHPLGPCSNRSLPTLALHFNLMGPKLYVNTTQVDGLISIMESENVGPFNLGNPGEFTMLELAKVVKETIDSSAMIEFQPNTADDPHKRKPDITKAKELLNWESKVSLREGLPLMVTDF